MPNTQRTPKKTQEQGHQPLPALAQPQVQLQQPLSAQPQPQPDQDVDFHTEVIRVIKANEQVGEVMVEVQNQQFGAMFRQKNGHVKRTITRATNILSPMESQPITRLHLDDIALLRSHLGKISAAMDALNDYIDKEGHILPDRELDAYQDQAESHTPHMLDLRARVNFLEQTLSERDAPKPVVPQPPTPKKHVSKIDNTFRPRPLDTSATQVIFEKWKSEFLVYMRRNGFEDAPVDEVRVLLNNCLTPDMEKTLVRVCEALPTDNVKTILEKLQKYVTESNNLTMRRFQYFHCIQHPGETIREYIIRFRGYGDFADFDNFSYKESMACRLVTGIHDDKLRRELLRIKNPDYDTLHDIAVAWESSAVYSSNMVPPGRSGTNVQVDKVSAYKANKKSNFREASAKSSADNKGCGQSSSNDRRSGQSCYHCGGEKHGQSACPARDQNCSYCKKRGHYAKVCRKRKKANSSQHTDAEVRAVDNGADDPISENQEEDTSVNIGTFDYKVYAVSDTDSAPLIHATLFNGSQCLGDHPMVPDTGAAVSILPAAIARKWTIELTPLKPNHSLRSVNKAPIVCIGTVQLAVRRDDRMSQVKFFVCDDIDQVILSWRALRDMFVIHQSFPQTLIALLASEVNSSQFSTFRSECLNQYKSVFAANQNLTVMKGSPMSIFLQKDFDKSLIKQTYRPRPVPIPLRNAVQTQLDILVKQGIIRRITEPTLFLSPMVVVPKKNNTVRLVVDYTNLNQFIQRPRHPFPSVAEVRALIPSEAKYFATLDAVQGYLQIPLQHSSQHLTSFITPWGRFCYTRAPMGLASSGDEYCLRGDKAFEGVPNMIKVVDDILVFAATPQELFQNVHKVLKTASQYNIAFSPEKFHIGTSVDFVGLNVAHNSITPDRKHFEAIADFPVPKGKTDLRSFLGMVNQFSAFTPKIASLSKHFRPLLSKQTVWSWDESHQQAFQQLRQLLSRTPILRCFSPSKPTRLLTDASRLNGLGYALMQQDGEEWSMVTSGSRFINETESNYAVFELEALAIVWAIRKCRIFLLGLQKFEVVTDHRPLVSIFNSSRLSKDDNPRILRLMQQVSMYNFNVIWVPGKLHSIPDALSRAPVAPKPEDVSNEVMEINEVLDGAVPGPHFDESLRNIVKMAAEDRSYQDIAHAVSTMSLKDVKKLPVSTHSHVRILASVWNNLSVHPPTGLIMLDNKRLLVPTMARKMILKTVHAAHQGINRTKARMQSLYFWPGMANEVVQMVQACDACQRIRDLQPAQKMSTHPCPSRPFEAVSSDVFELKGQFFLVYVDRFSAWPMVVHFNRSPSSSMIMSALSSIFKDFGIPNRFRHDGATPFTSREFVQFLKENNIVNELSSAYYPQSNGHAEAAVKAMKNLVRKYWLQNSMDRRGFEAALLEWRNVPRYPANLSPAEMLFGRKLRTLAPCLNYDRIPENVIQNASKINHDNITDTYSKFNSRRNSLPPLHMGDQVRVYNTANSIWDKYGVIISSRNNDRSYLVDVEGKTQLRNRRFLKRLEDVHA